MSRPASERVEELDATWHERFRLHCAWQCHADDRCQFCYEDSRLAALKDAT